MKKLPDVVHHRHSQPFDNPNHNRLSEVTLVSHFRKCSLSDFRSTSTAGTAAPSSTTTEPPPPPLPLFGHGMAKPASSTRPFWWGGMAAFSAAAFFFLSCLLNLAYLSGTAFPNTKNPFRERKPGTFAKWTELDIGLLRQLWQYRVVSANLNIGASALITLAFFLLLGTIMSLADAFEVHGGQGAHKASKAILVPSFIFAAALAVLDLTFNAGAVTTAAFIYSRFSIDDQTVRARQTCCGRAQLLRAAEPQSCLADCWQTARAVCAIRCDNSRRV